MEARQTSDTTTAVLCRSLTCNHHLSHFPGQQRQAEEQRPDSVRQGQGAGGGVRAGRLHHHPRVQEVDGTLDGSKPEQQPTSLSLIANLFSIGHREKIKFVEIRFEVLSQLTILEAKY